MALASPFGRRRNAFSVSDEEASPEPEGWVGFQARRLPENLLQASELGSRREFV
ncbi:MAG: hypothetical protein V7K90_05820 [Nostoc sp.]|uniref:hypothetical protein n=1 Tax=Nostoc sp. TaxID=1180 RepID=UPI002FF67E95